MVVLVTGGSRGICAQCVRDFCARGDRVYFFYRSADGAAEALARETGATAMRVDVSDRSAVCAAVDRVIADTLSISARCGARPARPARWHIRQPRRDCAG